MDDFGVLDLQVLKKSFNFLKCFFWGWRVGGGHWTRNPHVISYQSTEDTEICELEARALRAEAEVLRWFSCTWKTCGAEEDNHGVQFLPCVYQESCSFPWPGEITNLSVKDLRFGISCQIKSDNPVHRIFWKDPLKDPTKRSRMMNFQLKRIDTLPKIIEVQYVHCVHMW